MTRVRSPNREKAYEIYKENNGNIDLVKIAEQLSISPGTVRGWKNKDSWEEKLNGTFQKPKNENKERSNKKKQKKETIEEPIVEEVKQVLQNTKLTEKQRLFCIYYIKCFNATKAYKKAYGCDYITANTNGPRMLVNARIGEEIKRLKEGKLNRALLSGDDIFQRYIDIAFADIRDYLKFGKKYARCWGKDENGNDIPIIDPETGRQKVIDYSYIEFTEEVYENDTSIISEISRGKDGLKVKLEDKMKALQWLSDRMDILPTETRIKLENEQQKLNIFKLKSGVLEDDETVADDGFIDALHGAASKVWSDEEHD